MTHADLLQGQYNDQCGEDRMSISHDLAQGIYRELRAATQLADACRNSGDETIQAALNEYLKVRG